MDDPLHATTVPPGSADGTVPRPRPLAVSLYVTVLGLWMGAATFFSGVVLPALFLGLDTREAGGTPRESAMESAGS